VNQQNVVTLLPALNQPTTPATTANAAV